METALDREPYLSFSACLPPETRVRFAQEIHRRAVRHCRDGYPIECHPGSDDWHALVTDMKARHGAWTRRGGEHGRDLFLFHACDVVLLVLDLCDAGTERADSLARGIAETLRIELV